MKRENKGCGRWCTLTKMLSERRLWPAAPKLSTGVLATDDDLKLMAEKGTYLDPQAGLVWENYLANKEKFVGTPGYPDSLEGFAGMQSLIPIYHEFMRRAMKIQGLRIVFGTDALAGAHGRNAEEFIDRVRDVGIDPMEAMVSANSLGAKALGMADQIGSIAPAFKPTSSLSMGTR